MQSVLHKPPHRPQASDSRLCFVPWSATHLTRLLQSTSDVVRSPNDFASFFPPSLLAASHHQPLCASLFPPEDDHSMGRPPSPGTPADPLSPNAHPQDSISLAGSGPADRAQRSSGDGSSGTVQGSSDSQRRRSSGSFERILPKGSQTSLALSDGIQSDDSPRSPAMITLEQWKLQSVSRSVQKVSPPVAEASEGSLLSSTNLAALVDAHLARVGQGQPLVTSCSSVATSAVLEPAHLQPRLLAGFRNSLEGSGDPPTAPYVCSLGLRSSSAGGEVQSSHVLSLESNRPHSAGGASH